MTKGTALLLLLLSLFGCTPQLQRRDTSQITEAKEREEQQQKPATPTFTYRPGG
jgi:hypothetical protein